LFSQQTQSKNRKYVRFLVEHIRSWEHTTHGDVIGILIETEDTRLTEAELNELCQGIYPLGVINAAKTQTDEPDRVLRLGSRGVSIDGKLVGICEGLNLTLGKEITDAEMAALKNGQAIMLSRMGRG
jgi:hypothetical protein